MSLTGKTTLVTGAAGFIGSHLVERLVQEGAKVRAVARYNSHGDLGWLGRIPADVRAQLELKLGDVRDNEWLDRACEKVDVVFHLAASIAIPYSYEAPRTFVDTNVVGTLNVLEAARRQKVGRVVVTSTSEVYGTPNLVPITEDHPMQAQSPYAASKVAADQLSLSYQKSFGVPVVVLRPFNTYGPRQSVRAVIPTILAQLAAGKKQVALGRVDTKRDLTFVSDTVDGFVKVATAPNVVGETIQLGTGETHSVQHIFDRACAVLGVQAEVVTDERRLRPDASEVLVLLSDPSRAKSLLSWRAAVALDEGLRRTAAWLRDNQVLYALDHFHR